MAIIVILRWWYHSLTAHQHQKVPYSAKTGDNDCNVNSSRYSLSRPTALCESIRYQAKSEQNVRQDLIPRVRHGEAALMHPNYYTASTCIWWKSKRDVSFDCFFLKANTQPHVLTIKLPWGERYIRLRCGQVPSSSNTVTTFINQRRQLLHASQISSIINGYWSSVCTTHAIVQLHCTASALVLFDCDMCQQT